MRVLLSLSYGSLEVTKIVNLPEGLSPFKGMTIHTSDRNLVVEDVYVSIDKPNHPDDPSTILTLSDEEAGSLDSHKHGKILFGDICLELECDGWKIPFGVLN